MQLSYAQKKRFHDDGFLRIPGAVPRPMIDRLVRAINHSLGSKGMNEDDLPRFRARSYAPELSDQPVVTDMVMKTPLFSLIESLLGEGNVREPGSGQLALRFPGMTEGPFEAFQRAEKAHIDGTHSPGNGVPEGELHSFTMLLGVYLRDVPEPWAGNLTLWPGIHHQVAAHLQKHGTEALVPGFNNLVAHLDMPEPHQVTGHAGDAFLVHYLVPHGVAPHTRPDIRYATFFRIKHVQHDERRPEQCVDPWLDFPGMREVLADVDVTI